MKDKSGGDDYRNGNDPTPELIRIEAERKYHKAYGESDFGKD